MLYHTVLFQFPADTSAEVIDEVMRRHRELAEIPAVRKVIAGPNVLPMKNEWTHGMTIIFDSHTSMMEEFADHPLHQAILRDQFPLFSAVLAMDVEDQE